MSGFSQPIGRVSTQMESYSLINRLNSNQASLQTLSAELSSGQRLTQASDDPAAAVGIMRINQQVAQNKQYSSNLSFATSALGTADSTLGSLSTLVSSAQSVASNMVNTGTSADERTSEAGVIDGYISQALAAANTKYQNQSLFGGTNSTQNAFSGVGSGYLYQGTSQGQSILLPGGSSLAYTTDGSTVFGGVASTVGGGQNQNVGLTGNTKISDLSGARSDGVSLGTVNVTAGGTTVSVDLSTAATASDVVNLINAGLTNAGSNATVGISGGGFVVNGDTAQSVTISDAANGHTAADLGLANTFPSSVTTSGADVNAKVTATTPLSALNNGAGLDPTGFIITSGTNTATITLAGLNTVQDLVNAINGSGTNVTASISPNGAGIQIANSLSGVPLTIGENGGSTATQLGIRSLNAQTNLSDLNQGVGMTLASATNKSATGNLVVTETNGTQFNVKVDGITTQSQLVAAINAAGGGTVTASLGANNGITLTDTSGGSGNLSIAGGSNYVSNGTDFGIIGQGTGGTLTGTSPAYSTDDMRITRQDGSSFSVNLTGAKTIQDVLNKINTADGNTGATRVNAQLNPNGNGIELVDNSTGTGALTVADLNGSSAAQQLGILKTASGSPAGTINGDDVNPVEPQGLFTSLIMLRNALLNNDTAGITRAGQLLQADGSRIIQANGIIAGNEQNVAQRQSALTDEQTQLASSLSLLQDTDMTTVITQFQEMQNAYQASLQIAGKMNTLNLMNFIQ